MHLHLEMTQITKYCRKSVFLPVYLKVTAKRQLSNVPGPDTEGCLRRNSELSDPLQGGGREELGVRHVRGQLGLRGLHPRASA